MSDAEARLRAAIHGMSGHTMSQHVLDAKKALADLLSERYTLDEVREWAEDQCMPGDASRLIRKLVALREGKS